MQRPKSSFGQVETSPVSVCSVYIAPLCACESVFVCCLYVYLGWGEQILTVHVFQVRLLWEPTLSFAILFVCVCEVELL